MAMTTWSSTIDRYLAEGRTVSGGKEDRSGKAADKQMATNNANSSAALAQQSKFNQPVYSALIKYLQGNGEGMTPEEMSLLNSQFLNQNTQQFNSAGNNVRSALLSRGVGGGDQPVGGNFVRGISNLEGLKGATTAAGLRDIQLQNIQQRLANKFNAAGIFQGTGQGYGQQALGFGGLANQNVTQIHEAFRPGILENFGNAFGKSLGGALGGGIGGGLTGGLGGLIYGASSGATSGAASSPGFFDGGQRCWIARAIWGDTDPRVDIIRAKLFAWEKRSVVGKLVCYLYDKFGKQVAAYPIAVSLLKPVFNWGL